MSAGNVLSLVDELITHFSVESVKFVRTHRYVSLLAKDHGIIRNIRLGKAVLSADISLLAYEYCIHLKNYLQRQWCKALPQTGKTVVSYQT